MPGPLDGVRVLDFTEIIAGPFGAMLLADMGADVLKIEPPWGEPWRINVQFIPLESRSYISLNRGKRSLPLDLTKPEAKEIVYKLITDTDVVVVNYRPDVPYKLGVDYETLSTKNPRLIYCETTAFGRKGPDSQRPGYDIIAQAMTGLMTGGARVVNGLPQTAGATAIADYASGLSIAWGVCAALYARERTGRGQRVETSLLGSALGVQTTRFLNIESTDGEGRKEFLEELAHMREAGASYEEVLAHYQERRVAGARGARNIYYRTYQTKDSVIAVGNLSDPLRKKMADVLGLHDIRFEPGYDRTSPEAQAFAEELTVKAEALLREKTTEEWLRIFDAAGVPAGPVLFTEELEDDQQALANGLVVEHEHPLAGRIKMVGTFVKMSDTPTEARSASPALGQHTEEVLTALGYSIEDIQRLREQGVTR